MRVSTTTCIIQPSLMIIPDQSLGIAYFTVLLVSAILNVFILSSTDEERWARGAVAPPRINVPDR